MIGPINIIIHNYNFCTHTVAYRQDTHTAEKTQRRQGRHNVFCIYNNTIPAHLNLNPEITENKSNEFHYLGFYF